MRLTAEGAATRLEGPLLFLRRTLDVGLHDAVEVTGRDGRPRRGRVAALDEQFMTIEVLESTAGLALADTVVRFLGEPPTFGLAPSILGRVFNGVGQVVDGGPPIAPLVRARIDGLPINPVARAQPRDFIETGVTTLDLMNSLVRGQKLPIFSCAGLPASRLAAQIVRQARTRGGEPFAVVFGAIGAPFRECQEFLDSFAASGAMHRTVVFQNRADDPPIERLLTPRCALTSVSCVKLLIDTRRASSRSIAVASRKALAPWNACSSTCNSSSTPLPNDSGPGNGSRRTTGRARRRRRPSACCAHAMSPGLPCRRSSSRRAAALASSSPVPT